MQCPEASQRLLVCLPQQPDFRNPQAVLPERVLMPKYPVLARYGSPEGNAAHQPGLLWRLHELQPWPSARLDWAGWVAGCGSCCQTYPSGSRPCLLAPTCSLSTHHKGGTMAPASC